MGHGQIAGGYGDMSHILSIYGIYGFWVKGILLHLYWGNNNWWIQNDWNLRVLGQHWVHPTRYHQNKPDLPSSIFLNEFIRAYMGLLKPQASR
jgi:hypothetical protein